MTSHRTDTPPPQASLTLPELPTGLWGLIIGWVARNILAPGLRYLADLADDYGDEEDDAPPMPTERARLRLPYRRVRRR